MSTTKWSIDPTHTEIGFKVKHMMFTNVSGRFDSFEGTVTTDGDNFENAEIEFSADVASINTGNADRDNHLKSADFFNAEQNKKLTFKSTSFTKKSGNNFELTGDLTLNGQTHAVTLPVEFSGLMTDPWGNTKSALSIGGSISRKQWGLTWNASLETGGVLVSDEVKFAIEVQLIKQ